MAETVEERSEIAFFDLETTVPTRQGQGFAILEFGAILVCPRKLVELRSYSTLVRPADLSQINSLSVRCNGITRDAVVSAPTFADIADAVYDLLQGRIWAGHNILRFDCARIREAFAEINRPAPEPKGAIDSLALLTQRFGRRAGDMKMATLAAYFGLGKQTHRSLDDVRMNLEVLKYCATVLFLESSLPDIFTENSWVSPNATTRSRNNGKNPAEQIAKDESIQSSSVNATLSPSPMKIELPSTLSPSSIDMLMAHTVEEANSSLGEVEPNAANVGPFDLGSMRTGIDDPLPEDSMEEEKDGFISQQSSPSVNDGSPTSSNEFLEPDEVSTPLISATLTPFFRGIQKMQILHQNSPLQLKCPSLKVRFGVSTKFLDHAGRPRLNFVADASPSLCNILDRADNLAQKLSTDSGSTSDWHHVVTRKPGFFTSPTVRLQLPTVSEGESTRWTTEIFQKENSATHKLVFSRYDIAELNSFLMPGNVVDAYFSLVPYDYQQNAGIRLVTKKLILHSN